MAARCDFNRLFKEELGGEGEEEGEEEEEPPGGEEPASKLESFSRMFFSSAARLASQKASEKLMGLSSPTVPQWTKICLAMVFDFFMSRSASVT